MRSSHGSAAGNRICIIGSVRGRPGIRAGCANIRFHPATSIDGHRAAAAEGSYGIRASVQRSNRVSFGINAGRIFDRGTTWSVVLCGGDHHNASSSLSCNSSFQRVSRTTFRRRTTPGVNCDVGGFGRIALAATYWVRSKEPLHAFDVPGRCAITHIHVAASNPLCPRCHPDLVTHPVITDRRARGVRAMEVIIARERRIVAARVADAVVDRVMPIVIVIGHYSIPTAIVRFQCVVCPANASVGARHHNILPVESQRPDVRRVRINNSRLNGRRELQVATMRSPRRPVEEMNFVCADCPRPVPRPVGQPMPRRSHGCP